MGRGEWLRCTDVPLMLERIWEAFGDNEASLVPQLHRFFVACCRRIWPLLPQEASRQGIEMAERYLAGEATGDELNEFNWHVEGAAFNIDYNVKPASIARWVEDVQAIPKSQLAAMLHPYRARKVDERELLLQAAYFADYAMIYPYLTPKRLVPNGYVLFLSADLLREHFGNLYPS